MNLKVNSKKSTTRLCRKNLIHLFTIFFLLQTSFVFFHTHKEENLHFHAENILTNDHTVATKLHCSTCEIIIQNSNYLYESIKKSFYESTPSIPKTKDIFLFFYSKFFFQHLGRAPPFQILNLV